MRRILAPAMAVHPGQPRLGSRLALSIMALCAGAATVLIAPVAAYAATCGTNAMYFVAHQDDDLLFQSPDLLHDVQSDACVTTVYLTAGDAGLHQDYWLGREQGVRAAYAAMAEVANSWTQSVTNAAGHSVTTSTLVGAPHIKQVYLRLPDGSMAGGGYPNNDNESLQKLWTGAIASIQPVDDSAPYTARGLVDSLAALMTVLQPQVLHVPDHVGDLGDGDHSDHHVSAYFARAAHRHYVTPHMLFGHQGYGTVSRPENVTGTDLTAKQNGLYTYAAFDANVCGSTAACAGTAYDMWLRRQYTVASESGPGSGNHTPTANAGSSHTVPVGEIVHLDGSASADTDGDLLTYQWTQTAGPAVSLSGATSVGPTFEAPPSAATLTFRLVVNDGQVNSAPNAVTITVEMSNPVNAAQLATASASSANVATEQIASAAIDGVADGYPGDYTKEWATVGGGVGSWLRLTWAAPATLNRVVLYDRPNLKDQVLSATLTFEGGTTVNVGALPNDGSPLTVTIPTTSTRTLTLTVTSVKATTENVGLAELEAWTPGSGNHAPTANAGSGHAVSAGATVHLNGSASSDPDVDPLSYQWTQTAGPTVSLSGATSVAPTFVAPASATALTFELVVNDGQVDSAPSSITIIVEAGEAVNVARLATASASSQNVATEQIVGAAIDGVVDGYPGDYTKEWATTGGGAGSWLRLNWAAPTTLARVVLYDRPNPNEQILSATLTFDGGVTINVGPLPNDGSPLTMTIPNITTRTLTLTVTSVSPSTFNVGLAEIQAWTPGSGNQPPTAAASSQNVSTQQVATAAIDGVVDGYPGDYTKEWATVGGGVGSWLRLTWAAPTTLGSVVLYDRPNPNDRILSATLTFDGGVTVSVGALPNDGSPLAVTFPTISTRTLTLTVTSVSSSTGNVGLAEIRT